ncbi:Trans-aconitate 2-methyltransferase [Halotydeus destructor]|nr:Trans-aconitate 2-methyltransferase [Halotydeus destructor]
MNVDPSLYDQQNQLQVRDAKVLLDRLQLDYGNSQINLAVDIGCGTGNITALICSKLNVDRVVAFDLSPAMVDFAKANYNKDMITYEVADAAGDWLSIADTLDVDSNADLVFSVHCFHWIPEEKKRDAIQNVYNLLSPGGRAYLVFFSWTDLLPLQERMTLDPKWRRYFAAILDDTVDGLKISTLQEPVDKKRRRSSAPFETLETKTETERLKAWIDLCSSVGFGILEGTVQNAELDFGNVASFRKELKALCHFLAYIPEAERDDFMMDYYAHIDRVYLHQQSQVVLKYQNIFLVIEKPSY